MSLADRYAARVGSGGAPTAPAPAAPAAPSAPPKRDLSAMRAQLATANGGVNPPEAAAALKDDALDPRTHEVNGLQVPIEPAAGGVAAGPSTPAASKPRTRRTRAQIEADEAAARGPVVAAECAQPPVLANITPAPPRHGASLAELVSVVSAMLPAGTALTINSSQDPVPF